MLFSTVISAGKEISAVWVMSGRSASTNAACFQFVDFQHIGDMGNMQKFCDLRAHLCGIAIGGLFSTNNQVGQSYHFNALERA
jgi:hypothetical protein